MGKLQSVNIFMFSLYTLKWSEEVTAIVVASPYNLIILETEGASEEGIGLNYGVIFLSV